MITLALNPDFEAKIAQSQVHDTLYLQPETELERLRVGQSSCEIGAGPELNSKAIQIKSKCVARTLEVSYQLDSAGLLDRCGYGWGQFVPARRCIK
ncbi:MAG: hypothetical protein R2911_27350 [Caldilineaceae bacterium]